MWTEVELGQVLMQRAETIAIDPVVEYPLAGVRGFGQGMFASQVLLGANTSYDSLYRFRSGDLVLSRVKGWEGAIAVVPAELDGYYGSKEFPAFRAVNDSVSVRYLAYWFQSPLGVAALRRGSAGMGARRERLREADFLAIRVPLPSNQEQLRIVARLDGLLGALAEAAVLRDEVRRDADALFTGLERRLWHRPGANFLPLSRVTTFLQRGRQSKQGDSSHRLIKTQHVQMGRLLASNLTLAADVAAKVDAPAQLVPGDVLIACSAAGCLGRVAWYVGQESVPTSTDTHVAIARADEAVVSSAFLYHYLVGAEGQFQLRSRERGDWTRAKVGFRFTELNLSDLCAVPVPVPLPAEQAAVVAEAERLVAVRNEVLMRSEQAGGLANQLAPEVLTAAFSGRL